jgi:acetolactate synthase-1/2/3 large subunit
MSFLWCVNGNSFLMRYASTEMIILILLLLQRATISKQKVIKREDLDAAVANDGFKDSYLLRIMVEKENNVFPMIPTGASVSEIRLS